MTLPISMTQPTKWRRLFQGIAQIVQVRCASRSAASEERRTWGSGRHHVDAPGGRRQLDRALRLTRAAPHPVKQLRRLESDRGPRRDAPNPIICVPTRNGRMVDQRSFAPRRSPGIARAERAGSMTIPGRPGSRRHQCFRTARMSRPYRPFPRPTRIVRTVLSQCPNSRVRPCPPSLLGRPAAGGGSEGLSPR